jgi:hypothetical protein
MDFTDEQMIVNLMDEIDKIQREKTPMDFDKKYI